MPTARRNFVCREERRQPKNVFCRRPPPSTWLGMALYLVNAVFKLLLSTVKPGPSLITSLSWRLLKRVLRGNSLRLVMPSLTLYYRRSLSLVLRLFYPCPGDF